MRIDPPVSVPIDPQPMPAATAAAEPPLEPPGERARVARVVHGPECRFIARRAQRELVKVGFAEDDGAGLAQPGHDSGVGVRHVPRPHARCSRRREPLHIDDVLDGNRSAVQRTARPPVPELFVECARLLHGVRLEDRDECVEGWVQPRDAVECFAHALHDGLDRGARVRHS